MCVVLVRRTTRTLNTLYPKGARSYTRRATSFRFRTMGAGSDAAEANGTSLNTAGRLADAVLTYWLGDPARFRKTWDPCTTPENQTKWFMKSDAVDAEIKERFASHVDRLPEIIESVKSSDSVDDKLAAIILGDQMSRNIYRGTAGMYQWDAIVLPLARSMVEDEAAFMDFPLTYKLFSLLPLMHSEQIEDQRACCMWVNRVRDATPPGEQDAKAFLVNMSDYAQKHYDIVARWGRFPHRNEILGRESTAEELKGLEDGSIIGF